MLSCRLFLQQEKGQERAARVLFLNLDEVSFIDHANPAFGRFGQVVPGPKLAQGPPRREYFFVPENVAFNQPGFVPVPGSIVLNSVDSSNLHLVPTFHFASSSLRFLASAILVTSS